VEREGERPFNVLIDRLGIDSWKQRSESLPKSVDLLRGDLGDVGGD
jgi:hypothetical protein